MRNGTLAALVLGGALAIGVALGGHLIGRGHPDAASRVIRNAQQGYFDIQDRDPFSPRSRKFAS